MSKSVPYHPFLIKRLQNPIYAAGYLETHLEDDGEIPDPGLIQLAFSNVAEALAPAKMSNEQAKLHQEMLDVIFAKPGSEGIYDLAQWLQKLGLKLTVTVAPNESVVPVDELTKELVIA